MNGVYRTRRPRSEDEDNAAFEFNCVGLADCTEDCCDTAQLLFLRSNNQAKIIAFD
jgi:hypothetical protein